MAEVQRLMRFTDPKKLVEHQKKLLNDALVKDILADIGKKSESAELPLSIRLNGTTADVVRRVKSGLRLKGWKVLEDQGSSFAITKGGVSGGDGPP